jgi:serine/threonine-protein kinase RsbW
MAGDEAAPSEYTVSGLAVPESIELLHGLLAEARADHPALGEDDIAMIETAIIEIAGNVVQHAPPGLAVVYTFVLEVLGDRLVGVLTHSGPEVEVDDEPTMPDDPLAESGRGLALAEAALDELRHEYTDDQNVWTLVRRRDLAPA